MANGDAWLRKFSDEKGGQPSIPTTPVPDIINAPTFRLQQTHAYRKY